MTQARFHSITKLFPIFKYIILFALFLWTPFVYIFTDTTPFELFSNLQAYIAFIMYFCGAVIANATAIGGGIVFNPMLQLIFGISGFSALTLAIVVQCTGMASGTYGWHKRGEFKKIYSKHLFYMSICAIVSTAVFFMVFLAFVNLIPDQLLPGMKVASAMVSFYVFYMLWKEIKKHKTKMSLDEIPLEGGAQTAERKPHDDERDEVLKVDWRIYPAVSLGALLNVSTAVGMGELTFSHLIKFYDSPAKRAVAAGALMQALSVITQTVFILIFMREYILVPMACIGLLVTMMGGRWAPFIMTRKIIEPYVKHALAFTAFGMGLTSVIMLLYKFIH